MNFLAGAAWGRAVRGFKAALWMAGLGGLLAGCAPAAVIDKLPEEMGLPAGTPPRPATAYDYPAVFDSPPPRPEPALSVEQQLKVEKELSAARDRQQRRAQDDRPAPANAPVGGSDRDDKAGAGVNP